MLRFAFLACIALTLMNARLPGQESYVPRTNELLASGDIEGALAFLAANVDMAREAGKQAEQLSLEEWCYYINDMNGRLEAASRCLDRIGALPQLATNKKLANWHRRCIAHVQRLQALPADVRQLCVDVLREVAPGRQTDEDRMRLYGSDDAHSALLAESLPLLSAHLGDDDPWTLRATYNAARAAHARRDLDSACELLARALRAWRPESTATELEEPSTLLETWNLERRAERIFRMRLAARASDVPGVAAAVLRGYREGYGEREEFEQATLSAWREIVEKLAEDTGQVKLKSLAFDAQFESERARDAQLTTEARARWAAAKTAAASVYGAGHEATQAVDTMAGLDLARRGRLAAAAAQLRLVGRPSQIAQQALRLLERAIADGSSEGVADWFELFHALDHRQHLDEHQSEQDLDAFDSLSARILPIDSCLRGLAPYMRAMELNRRHQRSEQTDHDDLKPLAQVLDTALAALPIDDRRRWRAYLLRVEIAKTVGDESTVETLWSSCLEPAADRPRHIWPAALERLEEQVLEVLGYKAAWDAPERVASLEQTTALMAILAKSPPAWRAALTPLRDRCTYSALQTARVAVREEKWEVAIATLDLLDRLGDRTPARDVKLADTDRRILADTDRRMLLRRLLLADEYPTTEDVAALFGKDSASWPLTRIRETLEAWKALNEGAPVDGAVAERTASLESLRRGMLEAVQALGDEASLSADSRLLAAGPAFVIEDVREAAALFGVDFLGRDPGDELNAASRHCLIRLLQQVLLAAGEEDRDTAPGFARNLLGQGRTLAANLVFEAWRAVGSDSLRTRAGAAGVLMAAREGARSMWIVGRHGAARALLDSHAADRSQVHDVSEAAILHDTALGMLEFSSDERAKARDRLQRAVASMRALSLDATYGSWISELALGTIELADGRVSIAAEQIASLCEDTPPLGGLGGTAIREALLALATVPALQPHQAVCEALRQAAALLPTTRADWILGPALADAVPTAEGKAGDPLRSAREKIATAFLCSNCRDLAYHAVRWWDVTIQRLQATGGLRFDARDNIRQLADERPLLDQMLSCALLLGAGIDPNEQSITYSQILQWKGLTTTQEHLRLALLRDWLRRGGLRRLESLHGREQAEEILSTFHAPSMPGFGDIHVEEHDPLTGRDKTQTIKAWDLDLQCTPERLAKELPSGTVLVDFVEYQGRALSAAGTLQLEPMLMAFVTRSHAEQSSDPAPPAVTRIDFGPSRTIRELVHAFRQAASSEPMRGADVGVDPEVQQVDAGARLRELVWLPIQGAIGSAQRVILCPDGPIAFLPIGALPGGRPGHYLLEERSFAIVQAPALLLDATLARIVQLVRGDLKVWRGLLLPRSDAADARAAGNLQRALVVGAVTFSPDGPHRPLPGTEAEMMNVARLLREGGLDVEQLRGTDATPDRVRELLVGRRIAHFATHAASVTTAMDSDPSGGAKSHLVLARPTTDPEASDRLDASTIAEADLDGLSIAVLSACETGLGEQAAGEGLLGLQRAFELAGAETVVGSLWKVPDAATQQLMARFYENLLLRKMERIDALRDAQLWMLNGGPEAGRRQPPLAWAAWQLSGEWR